MIKAICAYCINLGSEVCKYPLADKDSPICADAYMNKTWHEILRLNAIKNISRFLLLYKEPTTPVQKEYRTTLYRHLNELLIKDGEIRYVSCKDCVSNSKNQFCFPLLRKFEYGPLSSIDISMPTVCPFHEKPPEK